jgi:hypothetical protein
MPEPLTQKEVLAKLARGESFKDVEIGDVSFRNYAFKKELNLRGAVFTGKVNFEKTQFLNGATFFKAKFIGETNFSLAMFFDETDFTMATFSAEEMVRFTKAKFLGGVSFAAARFSTKGGASFQQAQFTGENGVIFSVAQFYSGADFSQAQFSNERGVNFSTAGFHGERGASFSNAKFSGSKGADFSTTQFSSEGGTNFNNAQFLGPGKTRFENTSFRKDKPVFFNKVEIDSFGSLQFIDVSLDNFLFRYTDLEKVDFKNVYFCQTKNWFFNREYLADEDQNKIVTKNSNKIKYGRKYYIQVEIVYRKLKENFETQRDYARAGDFHYGEMEMRRKSKILAWEERPVSKYLPFLKYLSLTQCYKIVSGYGEKWQQALVSFIAVWILFTGLNLPLIQPVQQQTTQVEKWQQDSLHRVTGSALFSFKVLTLQRWDRDLQLKGTSYLPGLFVSLQHLIGPTIIALMLLAIRRQFRR